MNTRESGGGFLPSFGKLKFQFLVSLVVHSFASAAPPSFLLPKLLSTIRVATHWRWGLSSVQQVFSGRPFCQVVLDGEKFFSIQRGLIFLGLPWNRGFVDPFGDTSADKY